MRNGGGRHSPPQYTEMTSATVPYHPHYAPTAPRRRADRAVAHLTAPGRPDTGTARTVRDASATPAPDVPSRPQAHPAQVRLQAGY